jgi:hypothetical protein
LKIFNRFFCELLNLVLALQTSGAGGMEELKEPLEAVKSVLPKNRHFQDVKKCYNKAASLFKLQPVTQQDKKK